MAEHTHTFASFADGAITIGYVYDTAEAKNPLRIVAVNNHPTLTLYAGVQRIGTGWSRDGSWGPNTGESITNIPPGQREAFEFEPDDSGEPGAYDTLRDLYVWARVSRDG